MTLSFLAHEGELAVTPSWIEKLNAFLQDGAVSE
jgi:hypothetical protein